MKFLSRLAVLMLCLISMPAFATDTGDVLVQVTDSDVFVNWTGNIDYQGGACCMYFRCYQDSEPVDFSVFLAALSIKLAFCMIGFDTMQPSVIGLPSALYMLSEQSPIWFLCRS